MKKIPRGIPCLIVIIAIFGYLSSVMGFTNMLNTIMRTAHDLLLNTVFYLMAMCVLTGALSRIFSVFGVVDLLQRILKPVLRPLFNLPGVSSAGALMTFLSDKPAIISVAKNPQFARYFKRFQHISLVNFAGSYAMGLLVIIFMMGHGFYTEPLYGLVGAIIGSIIAMKTSYRVTKRQSVLHTRPIPMTLGRHSLFECLMLYSTEVRVALRLASPSFLACSSSRRSS